MRVVEDERNDPCYKLLSLIVGWMAILQRRIGVAERWNRRAARKKAMLSSEALRMNMCDRLGGVGALERWEERARLALLSSRRARDPAAAQRAHRRDDGKEGKRANPTPSSKRRPGSSESVEFALARMPGRGVRRVTKRIVRAAPRHETPIPVWPCEVMPERFAREWWREGERRIAAPSYTYSASKPEPVSGLKKAYSRKEGAPTSCAGAMLTAFA